jgi:hypothetical protein
MALVTHIDTEYYSGFLNEPPPFKARTRLVLSDDGVGIFLRFGPSECPDSELLAITLTTEDAKQLRMGLAYALGNLGEYPSS